MAQQEAHTFGKYQLVDRIAIGGMAEIYRARYRVAQGITKQVVVKKILPHYAGNSSFVSMFTNEAKIAVGLSHGNIAQVFDFGQIDGEYFLAMEFVDGQPLSSVMKRAKELGLPALPTHFAADIAIEVCKGLHYAHTRLDEDGRPLNIIHRDISPQNLIISYEGQVKIVDFGIAKARNAGGGETETGAVKGKFAYFAPEQVRGKELDARTDVFATGTCLYEMVCGRLPFEGRMLEVLGKLVHGEFAHPRDLNVDLPIPLEDAILRAMKTDPKERFQTAQQMQEALTSFLYTQAPTFSVGQLGHFMSYLFEKELVADGRPVQLPAGFLSQAPSWRKRFTAPAPVNGQAALAQVPAVPTVFPPTDPVPDRATRAWRWQFAAVPLMAMFGAALVVLLVGHFGSFAVRLTSTPPGATVLIDGKRAPGVTPMLISNLAANTPHEIRVELPGRRVWQALVSPAHGATVVVHANLPAAQ